MANIVKIKRSSVVGKAPVAGDIEVGEPAVNLADRILYTKDAGNTIIVIGSGYTSNIIEGTNLYFSNARVVTAISSQTLTNATFTGDVVSNGVVKSFNSAGDEGGEFQLAIPVTNTTLSGSIAIDVYQNRLRIFETTGTNRGVYIDLSVANAGVGTNLVSAGGGGGAVASVNGQIGTVLLTTANIAESGNLYYTNTRVYSNVVSIGYATNSNVALKANIADLTTSNVSEGTNLYFTNTRARQALTAGTGVSYNSSTGTIAIGQNVDTHSSVTFGNVTVTGNLTVQGNAIIFESNTLVINDPLIQVGRNPAGDSVDLGFFGHYIGGSPSIERHAGLFRDASDGQFKLFANLDPEPVNVVDTSNVSYQSANLVVNFVVGKVTDISNHATTNLAEGTNLYYTNARVYSNVIQLGYITASNLSGYATNSQLALYATNSQLGLYATNSQLSAYALDADLTTANVTELTNLYYTNARVYSNVTQLGYLTANALSGYSTNSQLSVYATNSQLSVYATNAQLSVYALTNSLTTANVTELTNLYFTNARSYSNTLIALSGGTGIGYSTANGRISLATSGVTSGTYGGNSVASVVTIDAFGRVTSASNVNITLPSGYATNSQLALYATNAQLASYATNSQLSVYATNAQLSSYALTANLTTANVTEVTNLYFTNARSYANTLVAIKTGNGIIYSNATGNITLSATGVTAATYGSGTVVPVITVDAYGRIISVSNVNISGGTGGSGGSGSSNPISNTQIISGDGTTTNFNLANSASTSNTLIFVDGLLQYSPTHYSFSSNTISFVTAPASGEQIYIATLGGGGASVTVSDSVPSASTAGTFWFDSLYLDLYVSYDNTWVMVGGSGAASAGDQLSALLLPGM